MFSMESVYFLETICISKTDEGKIRHGQFHIHNKMSVDYSTEFSHRSPLWDNSPPSPRQVTSETRHVSLN